MSAADTGDTILSRLDASARRRLERKAEAAGCSVAQLGAALLTLMLREYDLVAGRKPGKRGAK